MTNGTTPIEATARIEAFAIHVAVHGPLEVTAQEVEALGFPAMIVLRAAEGRYVSIEDISVDPPSKYRITALERSIGILPENLAQIGMAF